MKLLKIVLLVLLIQSVYAFSNEYKWMKNGVIDYPGNVEVSPDCKYCALGGGDNSFSSIQVYDLQTANVKMSIFDKFYGPIFNKIHFDFTIDSKNLIFPVFSESMIYQRCRIVSIENQEIVKEISFSGEDFSNDLKINSIFTLKSGKILIILTSFLKSKFVVWDYVIDKIEKSEEITTDEIRFFGFNKNLNIIVFLTDKNEIITYSTENFTQINKWTIPTNTNDYIQFMDVSSYGSQIAVGYVNNSGDAGIKIYDLQNGKLIDNLIEEFFDLKFTNGVCFTKDGKKMIYPRNSDYKIVNLDNTKNVAIYPLLGGDKFKIIDENRIISYLTLTVSDGMAYVIDIYTGNLISRLNPFVKDIDFVDFSYDDKYITILMENAFGLLDAETGNVINFKYVGIEKPYWFESSPNQYEIIYPSFDNSLVVFDYKSGSEIYRLTGHDGVVTSGKYSKDGKLFISTSEDKTVKIWDLESGLVIFDYISDKNPRYAGFTQDSNIILVFYIQDNFPGMFLLDINSKNVIKIRNVGEIPWAYIAYKPCFTQSINYDYFSYAGNKAGIWIVNDLTVKKFLNIKNCDDITKNMKFANNNLFLTGICSNRIMIWDMEGKLIEFIDDNPKFSGSNQFNYITQSIAISNDSKYILTANSLKYLTLWNAPEITSISDEKTLPSDEIYVYPNPATESVNIQLPEFSSEISYQVYNSIGELIIEERSKTVSDILSIPTSVFISGYYFCRIVLNNKVINKSFLIQK